ncbi:clusterin-associated protein 1-like [Paramacrobiotus metropolitanus]|uniref:clusterin-associated protein 1-like n=1 Tax=Paramacrobiotus metropolitanus TaxID=2943436 RepID=UPI002445B415|nr:clusterin-associated protein 1-like [Paramacrobiotus metropolitanus]
MSYKETKEFVEILAELECPESIQVDSFQYPNFVLIAKLLHWLILKCDAAFQLPLEIEAEQDRIFFLKAGTDHMADRYSIILDPRKLYMADGHAVREMLKIARVLHQALASVSNPSKDVPAFHEDAKNKAIAKIMDLKAFRKEQGDLVLSSAEMFDLLRKEPENHVMRLNALNLKMDPLKVDEMLAKSVSDAEELTKDYSEKFENIAYDKANLEAKIRKREEEFDRLQKRYQTVQNSKPGFLDETDKLQVELKKLYERYCVRYRNLIGLEDQVKTMEEDLEKKKQTIQGKDESETQRIDDLGMLGLDNTAIDDGFNDGSPEDEPEPERRRMRGLVVRENAIDEVSVHSRDSPDSERATSANQISVANRINGNPPELSDDDF